MARPAATPIMFASAMPQLRKRSGNMAEKSGINLYSGTLSQGLVHFVDHARHAPQIITGELAGDQELYDFCGQTPQVTMATVHVTHNLRLLAQLPRFVSINSAVEIDLHGQSEGVLKVLICYSHQK